VAPLVETAVGPIWLAQSGRNLLERPPLLLIHGAGGSHLHWPAQLRRLPKTRVLALDLPGHGRSPEPGRDTIAAYVTAVLSLLDALEIERAVFCGHSMGGAISQWAALEYPERVAGLVLVGAGAKLRVAPAILDGLLQDFDKTVTLITDWAFGPAAPPELKELSAQVMTQVSPTVIHGDFSACDHFDIREQIGQIAAPTLVVGGTVDRLTPLKFSEYLTQKLPHAQLEIVQDAGHMMALERPEQVGAAVGRFMAQFAV